MKWFILLFLSAIAFLLNLLLGSVSLPAKEVLDLLFFTSESTSASSIIVLESRLPEAITAVLAGAGLAAAGLMMQTLFRNPLAGPSVLGISSGASLGVALVVLTFVGAGGLALHQYGVSGNLVLVLAAIMGAMAVLLVMLMVMRYVLNNVTVLIVGLMIGYATSAVVSILLFQSTEQALHTFVLWGLGSFSNVADDQLIILSLFVAIGLLASFFLIKPMDALLLGDDYASSLGANVRRTKMGVVLWAGLLAGSITACCGPIAFLGLAVPHLARIFFRSSKHAVLLPGAVLMGVFIALLCDLLARMPGVGGSLPINAVTSMIGAPVVVWIVLWRKNFRSL